jgi:hypothetical protein
VNRTGAPRSRQRGEPAIALVAVLGCWALARGTLLAWPGDAPSAAVIAPMAVAAQAPPAVTAETSADVGPVETDSPTVAAQTAVAPLPSATMLAPLPLVPLEPSPLSAGTARVAASHQLLYLAAFAQLPLPPEVLAVRPDLAAPVPPLPLASRWSGDGWLLWRQDSGGLPVGGFAPASYGASQAGAVLRYRLVPGSRHQPLAYLRITSALASPGQPEAAFGIGARPLPRVPVSLLAELRLTESGGRTRLRPAVAVVAGLPRQRLPFGFGVEAYGQAGYVAGPDASGFVDGQARLDRRIVRFGSSELRGGGAVWGGAQRGAGRLDVGPGASVQFRLGQTSARLSADWRFRVAGQAAPASGPAVTLSAGF